MTPPTDEAIQRDLDHEMLLAELAHEVNRAIWDGALREPKAPPWAALEDHQREPILAGVRGALAGKTPQQIHESWLIEKTAEGWCEGPYVDASIKQHPCLVPYHRLPVEQQMRDHVFKVVVKQGKALIDRLTRED